MNTVRIALAATLVIASTVTLAQAPETTATEAGAAAATTPAPAAPAPKLSYTDDYRINVNHDADSDGQIVFRVTIKDGESKDITVSIKKGTSENSIAREIKEAFVEQLGTKHYSIEMQEGENVIIERSGGKANTSLVLVSSTVMGITVKVHRD